MVSVADFSGTSIERLDQYVESVLSRDRVVGRLERLAVERHVHDLAHGEERGLYFDIEEAELGITFVECLKHSKGEWAGQTIHLEPVQCFMLGSLFGWQRQLSDGTWGRRFNYAFVSLARKNAKSTIGAAIGHKLFVADGELGAEVFTAATKRDQAKIVHEEAKRMVRSSPDLSQIVSILRDNMFIEATSSKYEPLGADADTTDGLNLSGAIIDELHAHRTRQLWDVLDTATGARRNPLLFVITTAGAADNTESIYLELKNHSIDVLEGAQAQDGLHDDSWFALICMIDDEDDWADEACWPKANPLLHVSVKVDDLRRKALRAKTSPASILNFRRRHCNQDVELNKVPWVSLDAWGACLVPDRRDTQPPASAIIDKFRGRSCAVGGDFSAVQDLTAITFAFSDDDGSVDVVPFIWCPRGNAIGRQRDKRIPYLTWAEAGYLELTEGDAVDYNAIRHLLCTARDEWGWQIKTIGVDPNNVYHLLHQLEEEDGFGHDILVAHVQTATYMNDPIATTERLILEGKLRHGENPVVRWTLSNVLLYADTGGRRRFDKKKSRDKIDPAVSLVMAVWYAVSGRTSSVYDTRGVLEV